MSDSMHKLSDWQRRFYAGPRVWAVLDEENLGNYYTTREAAEIELEWRKQSSTRGKAKLVEIHLHTPELSQERWQG